MGLLDFDLTPQQLGLLGAASAASQAYAPQPASRLPLARPNMAYLLGQAAGGLGQGYGAGLAQQGQKTQTVAQQIKNLNDTVNYNLWAPYLRAPTIPLGAPGMTGTGSSTPSAGPAVQIPGAQGAAPPAGAITSPPAGGSVPSASGMDMRALYNLPPPVLQRMGIPVPPELTSAMLAGIQPGTPQYQTLVTNLALKGAGITPSFGGDRPGVPFQQSSIGPDGQVRVSVAPGSLDAMQQGAFTQARSQSLGALGPKEAEASFKAGLDVRVADETERRKAFYQTGMMPPAYGTTAQPTQGPNGEVATERGTVVPPAPPQPFQGTDALVKQNANTADTEKNFGAIRAGLDGTESRMAALAQALQAVQGKGFNERRAGIANNLRGLGMNGLADTILSAKETSAVQKALGLQTMDVLGQLKQINAGTGGRILNSEFTHLLDTQYGPDMSPEANYDLITQALGGVYQTRNMIDDYYKYAKPGGWRDANSYMSSYYSQPQNSYSSMVKRAGDAIGPLKGMTATAPEAAIKALQMRPDLASEFDAKYGAGASKQYLGK